MRLHSIVLVTHFATRFYKSKQEHRMAEHDTSTVLDQSIALCDLDLIIASS